MKRPTYATDAFLCPRNQHKQEFPNGDNRIIERIRTERVFFTGSYPLLPFI